MCRLVSGCWWCADVLLGCCSHQLSNAFIEACKRSCKCIQIDLRRPSCRSSVRLNQGAECSRLRWSNNWFKPQRESLGSARLDNCRHRSKEDQLQSIQYCQKISKMKGMTSPYLCKTSATGILWLSECESKDLRIQNSRWSPNGSCLFSIMFGI